MTAINYRAALTAGYEADTIAERGIGCGRLLTKGASIDLGIGPICAAKYGW